MVGFVNILVDKRVVKETVNPIDTVVGKYKEPKV